MNRQEAMDIYKDRSSKFINTQSIQWKINISIWTLFAMALFYKKELNFLSSGDCILWSCLIGILLVLVHGFFCYKIQKSLESDKAVKKDIVKQLNDKVTDDLNVNVDLELKGTTINWSWIILQTLISVILAFVLYML